MGKNSVGSMNVCVDMAYHTSHYLTPQTVGISKLHFSIDWDELEPENLMSLLDKETTSTIVGKLMVWKPCLCFLRNFSELSVCQVAEVSSDFKCIQKTGRPGHPLLPTIFCYLSFLPKSILYRTLDLMVKRYLQSSKDKCDQQASESTGGVPPVLLQCVGSL